MTRPIHMSANNKHCVDCRYYSHDTNIAWRKHNCTYHKKEITFINPVTGEEEVRLLRGVLDASMQRKTFIQYVLQHDRKLFPFVEAFKACGPNGSHWEDKNELKRAVRKAVEGEVA